MPAIASATIKATTLTGTLSTAAQPNVTSLGTLTSLTTSGTAYIGDTANADVTLGLTINQGAADNQILALKSSDVAHGMTDIAETDTFGYGAKISPTAGGVAFVGLTEETAALQLAGFGTNDDTTKTSGGSAYIVMDARKKSGTTVGAPGANANLLAIGYAGTQAFLFDKEGDAHADSSWTTF